jgi:hypothetical protein
VKPGGVAAVRWHVSRISGVCGTWFEWESYNDNTVKTLVVEVDFNTDPNSSEFRQEAVDAILTTTKDVLANETTMIVSRLRIVPRLISKV